MELKKFSITGGSGISLKGDAECGKKTYWHEDIGFRMKGKPLYFVTGGLVHDGIYDIKSFNNIPEEVTERVISTIESGIVKEPWGDVEIDFKPKDDKKKIIEEVLMLIDKGITFPTKAINSGEIYIEVPLIDPDSGKVFYEDQVRVCGKIDMVEKIGVSKVPFKGTVHEKDWQKKRVNVNGGWMNQSDIDKEESKEMTFVETEEDSNLCISDYKTCAYPSKNMDKHFGQVKAQYPYLWYTKNEELPDYASIIELPKNHAPALRHIVFVSMANVIDAFKFIKNQVESILNKDYVPNYSQCEGKFFRCMYFEACHRESFNDPDKILASKFRIKNTEDN